MQYLFILFAANFIESKTLLKVIFFQLIRIIIYIEQQQKKVTFSIEIKVTRHPGLSGKYQKSYFSIDN